MNDELFFDKQRELVPYIKAGAGCRIGETAVCSRKVHTVDPYRPEAVTIVSNADAGQVFYRRQRPDEIIHIDIFHAVGRLRPQPLAQAIKSGLDRYAQCLATQVGQEQARKRYQLPHFFDLQTGLGGGRVTGSQQFGQRESAKQAHLNHVHISGKLDDNDLAAVFFVVAAVEKEIVLQGLELRRVDHLQHQANRFSGKQEDISPYTAFSDTFLREGPLPTEDQAYGYQLSVISDIMENLEDLQELSSLLQEVEHTGRGPRAGQSSYLPREVRLWDTWLKLEGYGLIVKQANRYQLSDSGLELSRRLLLNSRELEAALRQQSLYFARQSSNNRGSYGVVARQETPRRGEVRRVVVKQDGDFLAVNPTVTSALSRQRNKGGVDWEIRYADLRFEQRLPKNGIDICLLLDASASMLGKRMKAARNLAEHLVQNSRDRIAVITFQEQAVDVVVPFTRNRLSVRQSLELIKPGGLTPLAAGLRRATQYVRDVCRRPGLLLLITDGIPTLGDRQVDPLHDALAAAETFRDQTEFHLCCVGLQPNHNALRKVVEAAAGSLHIIDELNTANLVHIATGERNRAKQKQKML